WIKAVDRRSKNQRTAHLLITLAEGEEVERLLTRRRHISVWGRMIPVERDQKIPVRCAKCQCFSHYASDCLETDDTCGKCGEKGHKTKECNSMTTHCINCKEDGHKSF
ncbi:hypothetical protein P691DRAFT_620287, partial [Macrolepiota fuliginosa MF-IS2]